MLYVRSTYAGEFPNKYHIKKKSYFFLLSGSVVSSVTNCSILWQVVSEMEWVRAASLAERRRQVSPSMYRPVAKPGPSPSVRIVDAEPAES